MGLYAKCFLQMHLVEGAVFDLGIEDQCVRGEHVQGEVRGRWGGGGGQGLPAEGIRASQGTFSSW